MIAFLFFTVIALYFTIRFYVGMKDLVLYSKENSIDIFDKRYNRFVVLYGDINFLSELFSGEKIKKISDTDLSIKLKKFVHTIYINFFSVFWLLAQLLFKLRLFSVIIRNSWFRMLTKLECLLS